MPQITKFLSELDAGDDGFPAPSKNLNTETKNESGDSAGIEKFLG